MMWRTRWWKTLLGARGRRERTHKILPNPAIAGLVGCTFIDRTRVSTWFYPFSG